MPEVTLSVEGASGSGGNNSNTGADDIRSSLAAAYAEQETRESDEKITSASDKEAVVDVPAGGVTDGTEIEAKPTTERVRGPDGKFIKSDKADDADAPAVEAQAEPVDEGATPEPAADTTPAAIKNWSATDKEMFKAQSPEAQSFILRRHHAMEADHTKKTQAIAAFRNEYEPVEKMFAPHRDVMRQKGFTPASLITAWANVETRLASGDGINVIRGLIDGYGIDRGQLANALGLSAARNGSAQNANGGPGAHPDLQNGASPYTVNENGEPIALPPEIMRELQKISALEARVSEVDNFNRAIVANAQNARASQMMNHIESFKSASDEQGNLKHPHFEEVEDDMTTIANGLLARRQAVPPLDELYERAVNANPSTRVKIRTAERQSAEQKARDEARAKATAARKAGASVTGSPSTGQTQQARTERSLREELEAAAQTT